MHIILKLLNAMLDWLTAVEAPVETSPSLLDWSDLPPHHPLCE
jgi:hypothetical protein